MWTSATQNTFVLLSHLTPCAGITAAKCFWGFLANLSHHWKEFSPSLCIEKLNLWDIDGLPHKNVISFV